MKRSSEQIMSAICDEIAVVTASEDADLDGTLNSIGPLLEWVILNEQNAVQPDKVINTRKAPVRQAAAPHLTAKEMTHYLRDRFDDPNAHATNVSQIVGGFSKRTTRVACNFLGSSHILVLRQTVNAQADDILEAEYEVLCYAWTQGINAPEPLWIETAANLLGGPFFVTRFSEGVNPGDVFGRDRVVLPNVGEELAVFLAKLHSLDCAALHRYPVSAMASAVQIRQAVESAYDNLRTAVGEPETIALEVFDWLGSNVPPNPPKQVLVHGDIGFHNLLVDKGSVTAVLDWERAHLGDQAEDLAYLRPTLNGILDWGDFLTAYESAGGTVPDSKTLRFYTVWQDLWRYVACLVLLSAHDVSPRLSSLFAGRIFAPRFLADATTSIQSH